MKIQTAQMVQKYRTSEEYEAWLRHLARQMGVKSAVLPVGAVDKAARPAIAYVNYGRWVADCPAGCGAAMLVDPELPFLCGECFNEGIGGLWRLVKWPAERLAIETELELRLARNAHWSPGETVAALRRENAAHGVTQ